MRLIMQLNHDEVAYLANQEWHPSLQRDTAADGMDEDVIGGPFMFELPRGERVVFENACTHSGGAILTHAEALDIIHECETGEEPDHSLAGWIMRRLNLSPAEWDAMSTGAKAYLITTVKPR